MQGEGVGVLVLPAGTTERMIMIPSARVCLVVLFGFLVFLGVFLEVRNQAWKGCSSKSSHKAAGKHSAVPAAICAFLANKERRRSALLPPCFHLFCLPKSLEAKNLPFPNCSWLQALLKMLSPYLYAHLTLFYASPSTKCKKIINLSTTLTPCPSPVPQMLLCVGPSQHGFGL